MNALYADGAEGGGKMCVEWFMLTIHSMLTYLWIT